MPHLIEIEVASDNFTHLYLVPFNDAEIIIVQKNSDKDV